MKVYLASPFFNDKELKIYNEVISHLRAQGIDLFVPKEHTIPNAWDLPNHLWGENVFAVDYLAIQQSDVVVVLNFGMYSDSGTAWECGAAFALGKTVVNILCDNNIEYSIMMVNGTNVTIDLDTLYSDWFKSLVAHKGKTFNQKISQK